MNREDAKSTKLENVEVRILKFLIYPDHYFVKFKEADLLQCAAFICVHSRLNCFLIHHDWSDYGLLVTKD